MNCNICGKPVVLVPSAAERARKSDKPASYYTGLFPTHASCAVKKRTEEAKELMRKINNETGN